MMPPAGARRRGDSLGTLARVIHARETDPELGRLLDALEPWAAEQDPDSDDARAGPLGPPRLREVRPRARTIWRPR